jgi:carbon monoxide dehydrogenase subunit G
MKIAGQHHFHVPRERVWDALHDPRTLAAAVPGVRRLEPTGGGEYAMVVDVGVGSVRGTYEGTFSIADDAPPDRCVVTARARGAPGSVETVARLRLADEGGDGALLAYEADADVTGPLAGVGQRLVAGAARKTTERFFEALEQEIRAPTAEPAPGGAIEPVRAARGGADPRVVAASAVAGAAIALLGVAVGRWTARR